MNDNPRPGSLWLVTVECRHNVIRVCSSGRGFYIPGQEPCWDFSHVEEWIQEIIPPNIDCEHCTEGYVQDAGFVECNHCNVSSENNSIPLFGLVNFEEPGMPWTRVCGSYELIKLDDGKDWDGEPHWEIKLENGDSCFVPQSSVILPL